MSRGRLTLGANWRDGATRFEVWAPEACRMELVLEQPARTIAMEPAADGYFTLTTSDAGPGTLYRYRVDGRGPFPDPVSRFQPQGVHGPSQVVDPASYRWTDGGWSGVSLGATILYELHVGTFTPQGTFAGVRERLPYLRELGVSAIELMPIADFPGRWNWGYDGVSLFAPARAYGSPDDLRALVDAAHGAGIAVHLDVVYNHFGPDGAYQNAFSPLYISRTHRSPWGDTLNFDGEGNGPVRDFIVENALRWVREYHLDGLRLDATHAIVDESPRHVVTDLAAAVHDTARREGREVLVIVEDARNLRHVIDTAAGGWSADGVWSDDFHHQMRRGLAGDSDGYFADFTGNTTDIAETARRGWFYHGQHAEYFGHARGTDPTGLPLARFVTFLQNHDQTGNRALGERLHHQIDLAAWRAASALWALLPQTPLLFMGQEWGASAPFRFFTDHNAELGAAVTKGRREEFSRFAAFANPASIPDPQDPATFEVSRLQWEELQREPFRSLLELYRRLLELRRTHPALQQEEASGSLRIRALDDAVIALRRDGGEAQLLAIVRLRGAGESSLSGNGLSALDAGGNWTVLLDVEAGAADARPADVDPHGPRVRFMRPGAVLFAAGGRR